MNNLEALKTKVGKRWDIFKKVHLAVLSAGTDINFRIFPIYVSYFRGEKTIAVVYFRGKFINENTIDVGLNLLKRPTQKGFTSASYMKYPGITYSVQVNSKNCDGTVKLLKNILKKAHL